MPWLASERILIPTDFLSQGLVPGLEEVTEAGRYGLLNDVALQFLPWEVELRKLWRSGHAGFWSDALEGGSSPWRNPQATVLSPIAWVARLFPIESFFLVKLALQMLVCFLGVSVLVRRLAGSWCSAALGGLAAAVSGGLLAWGLFPHTAAAAWVPWTTAGLCALMRRPSPARLATTGLFIGFLLLSGHPEVAFAGGLLGVVVAAATAPRRRRTLGRRLGSVLVAALLGLMLAAPVLLPFVEAVPRSQRAAEMGSAPDPLVGFAPSLDPKSWFLDSHRRALLAPLHPYSMGVPFQSEFGGALNWLESGAGYAGLWALFGGVLAVGSWLRRALPLVAIAGFSWLAAAGFIPLVAILHHLPVFSVMALPRLLLVGSIASCVAAALAFDDLRKRSPSVLGWTLLAVASSVVAYAGGGEHALLSLVACGLLFTQLVVGDPARRASPFRSGPLPARTVWWGAQLALIVVAQVPWGWQILPVSQPSTVLPASIVFEALAASAEDPSGRGLPARVLGTEFLGYPSLLTTYGMYQTRPHNPMTPRAQLTVLEAAFGFAPSQSSYFSPVERVGDGWLGALGVRAILTTTNSQALGSVEAGSAPSGFELELERGPFRVFRNASPVALWYPARSWRAVTPERMATALSEWQESSAHVLVEDSTPRAERSSAGYQPALEILRESSGNVRLAVAQSTSVDGSTGVGEWLLATSLPGPSGWRARGYDDVGVRHDLERASIFGAFLGVWVPSEIRELELVFRPPLIGVGFVLAALGLVGCCVLWRRSTSPHRS